MLSAFVSQSVAQNEKKKGAAEEEESRLKEQRKVGECKIEKSEEQKMGGEEGKSVSGNDGISYSWESRWYGGGMRWTASLHAYI